MSSARELIPTATLPLADQRALENAGLKLGDVLDGKYQIDRVLGVGGMGLVLGAVHLLLRQPVALKLLLPSSLEDSLVVARFEREARAAAMLRSEHVARVIDVGRIPNGSPYMVMELLEGSDLEKVVEDNGPLAIDVAVNYLLQGCEAIAEAHALGIIHRDLKPHNLFLARRVDGEALVKVLDFGISKLPNEEDQALTRTRDVMGSPLYMAPEQLRSAREVDPRADIWALGAILFRLLTARTPFDGETMAQLCSRVLVDPPSPIRKLRPDVPEGLAVVIERCLEKEPSARYSTVGEFAMALDPFASETVVRAADRVIAISTRPPPSSNSVPPPPVSVAPKSVGTVRLSHPGSLTGKSLPAITPAISERPPKPKKRSWVAVVAFLAIAGGAGGAWATRAKWLKPVAAPPPDVAAAHVQDPVPPPSVSVAPVATAPVPSVSAAVSAEPTPSTSASHRGPPTRRPWKRNPASSSSAPQVPPTAATPADDAPDLRK